jgi:peptidoglycan/LPS O-acetylase OafA/YrhL
MHHQPALDGLRALAVLIVIVSHAGFGTIVPGGFGVTIFFFLSGYLITTLLRNEAETARGISLRQFYARRVLRIFPPLYISMAVVLALIACGVMPYAVGTHAVVLDGLFLTNYAYLWTPEAGVPMPLWSLDVEEHFYLLFPILFIVLYGRFRPAMVAAIIAALCAATLAIRLYNVATLPDFTLNFYWSHTRIDSILFGACLAVWNNPVDEGAWRPKLWHAAAAVALLLVTLAVRDPAFRESIRYSLQGVALFVIFSFLLHDQGWYRRILSIWPLKWIGLFSYTLYLCHMPAFLLVRTHAPELGTFGIAVAGMALSLAYAATMYWLVERPVARWRRSLHKAG